MKNFALILPLLLFAAVAHAQSCPAGVTWCTNIPGTNSPTVQSPQTTIQAGQINYTPLEPLNANSQFGYGTNGNFTQYLSDSYRIFVTIGSLLAIVLLVVGGIRYMFSEAIDDVGKARKQITAALWGLVIIVGSFLILYSINPNLLHFNLLVNPPGVNPAQQAVQFSSNSPSPNLTPQQKIDTLDSAPKTKENCQTAQQALDARQSTPVQGIYDILNWIKYGSVTTQSIQATYDYVKTCGEAGLL